MEGYSVKIIESSIELSAKEKIAFKNFDDCVQLDAAITGDDDKININPYGYVVVEVHNEKSDNKDYLKYIILDKDGTRYTTGSEPFYTTFRGIYDEMSLAPDEEWSLEVYKRDSKNYKGKSFLTCTII